MALFLGRTVSEYRMRRDKIGYRFRNSFGMEFSAILTGLFGRSILMHFGFNLINMDNKVHNAFEEDSDIAHSCYSGGAGDVHDHRIIQDVKTVFE